MERDVEYPAYFYQSLAGGARRSAEVVVPIVRSLLNADRVVDVGCGLGAWLAVFQQYGADVLGIDTSSVPLDDLVIPPVRFLCRDLTQPLVLDRKFNLALSLEVAEHLPATAAATLVASLATLAPIVLFSAAIPFQGGLHHLNEQWPAYWVALFSEHGMQVIDAVRPQVWNCDEVDWWYAQNMLLFATHAAVADNPSLQQAVARTEPSRLALVHPRNYSRFWPA